jgi:3-deoxy-manno-octulosonate cytidylyltransferase (CMP-KDO synthetase)
MRAGLQACVSTGSFTEKAAVKPIIMIPARMAATRLPGKPLADIGGVPMIVRVLRQAVAAEIGPVVVAAGDRAIAEAVEASGGKAVLTDPDLPSGSDRILAALAQVDPKRMYDAVINLQGDMPFVAPEVIGACASLLHDSDGDIATVVAPEAFVADRSNPDVVKAVLAMQPDGKSGRALYFTRSTLYGDAPVWRHIGIYGYRREALEAFHAAPPSALEVREKLEQLRALELGMSIFAAVADQAPISVDNPDDLEAARAEASR